MLIQPYPNFYQGTLWVNRKFYTPLVIPLCQRILEGVISGWRYTMYFYNSAEFGDPMVPHRVGIQIFRILYTYYNLDCEYPQAISDPR